MDQGRSVWSSPAIATPRLLRSEQASLNSNTGRISSICESRHHLLLAVAHMRCLGYLLWCISKRTVLARLQAPYSPVATHGHFPSPGITTTFLGVSAFLSLYLTSPLKPTYNRRSNRASSRLSTQLRIKVRRWGGCILHKDPRLVG